MSILSRSQRDKERTAIQWAQVSWESLSKNMGLGCEKASTIALTSAPDRTRKKHKNLKKFWSVFHEDSMQPNTTPVLLAQIMANGEAYLGIEMLECG